MKKIFIIIALLQLFFSTFIVNYCTGQNDSKYGKDSVKCMINLSLYHEFVKQKNYIDAFAPWKIVFNECPGASKNIYKDGVEIIKYFINKETDADNKNKLIDTLMMVYEQRIKYFGNDKKYPEGYILGRKGIDLLKYRKDKIAEAYQYLSESIKLQDKKTKAKVLTSYMQATIKQYKSGKITKEQVVENYAKAIEIIEFILKKNPENKNLNITKDNIEKLFTTSEAADCEALIKLFTPKFKESPEDIDLLKNITKLLDKQNCNESELFFEACVQLDKLEPSARSKYNIAKMSLKKCNYNRAANYYKQAIELEQDNLEKSKYYYELGVITSSKLGQPELARNYAYKAIELNRKCGKPYILIGNIYASVSKECGENKFEQRTVYWVAVDKYKKAKSIDPSVADEANKQIAIYSKYFPDLELIHFHIGADQIGKPYTVGCWINETTIVRIK